MESILRGQSPESCVALFTQLFVETASDQTKGLGAGGSPGDPRQDGPGQGGRQGTPCPEWILQDQTPPPCPQVPPAGLCTCVARPCSHPNPAWPLASCTGDGASVMGLGRSLEAGPVGALRLAGRRRDRGARGGGGPKCHRPSESLGRGPTVHGLTVHHAGWARPLSFPGFLSSGSGEGLEKAGRPRLRLQGHSCLLLTLTPEFREAPAPVGTPVGE